MKKLFDDSEEFGLQCNAVYNTLIEAGKEFCKNRGDEDIHEELACYDWLEDSPKTTLTVEFVEMLNKLGYKIIKEN